MRQRATGDRRQWLPYLLPATCCLLPLLLWLLAYQLPAQIALRVGGDVSLQRRFDENPFLSQINGSEPPDRAACPDDASRTCFWWQLLAPGERPYRWTSGETLATIPGLGGGPYIVEIAARGQPGDRPTPSDWQIAGLSVSVDLPPDSIRRYRILAPPDPSGDLRITLRTRPLDAPGDPRELGFVLYELRASQAGGGPRAPAWPQIGWLSLALAAVYGVPRVLSVSPRLSAGLALGFGVALALALALARPELTIFAPTLAGMGLVAGLAAAAGWALTRHMGSDAAFARQVLALTLLALALRVGGMLHPHALYSDSRFHANKLFILSLGEVFQTAGLPSEAGGGQAPYPTGFYVLLLPGLLLPGIDRVDLVQVGTALLDSLLLPMIALLIVGAGYDRRAALLGAACYLLPVTALASFSVGELANIGGQALAMGFVALLTLGALAPRSPKSGGGGWAFATAALAAGLLAHSGVTLSLGAFVAAAWLIVLAHSVSRRQARTPSPQRPTPISLTIVAAAGLAIALLIYYSAPIYLESIAGRAGGVRGGTGPLAILGETLAGVLGLIPPRSRAWPLPPLLGPLALTGMALLWAQRRARPAAAGLRLTLGAFWLGMLLTQALLLVADQGVRWSLFLYPALGLSAGPLLGALYSRGRAGRAAALSALGSILAYGLLVWIIQIRDYYHI